MKDISIKDFQIGNDEDFTLMGGMNVLESEETALLVAEKFKEVTDKLKISWINYIKNKNDFSGGKIIMTGPSTFVAKVKIDNSLIYI